MASINLKLGNMRKAQNFTIYPFREGDTHIIIQSDKRIARIDIKTGKGLVSSGKGGHPGFHALNSMFNPQLIQLSEVDLSTIRMIIFTEGATMQIAKGIITADNSGAKNILDM